jgi:hypothetical protein
MNNRIKRDLDGVGHTFDASNTYLLDKGHVKVKFSLPPNYPFAPPVITLVSPYEIVLEGSWYTGSNLRNFIDETIDASLKIIMPEGIKLQEHIPAITDPAYLVLGSSYDEKRNGRVHYDNPHVFLMDSDGSSDIPISFSDPIQLGIVSSLLSNKFDEICFDWSTLKFFTHDAMLLERLMYLKKMLKPGGKIFFENIEVSPGGGRIYNDDTDYHSRFIDFCIRAGFEIEGEDRAENIHSFLVPMLFVGDRNPTILIAHKPMKGGRKKRKTRRRKVRSTL